MAVGVIIINIIHNGKLVTVVNNKNTPAPNTPANPVPELKFPTTELGSELQNPSTVLSPKALTIPKMTAANKEKIKAMVFF